VIFDAGGTLIRLDYEWIAQSATERGHPLEPAALARSEAVARQAVDQRADGSGGAAGTDESRLAIYLGDLLGAAGVPPGPRAEIALEVEAEHRAQNLWRVPMPGASETLAALRARGFRLAVVSNADGRVEQGLEEAGLREHLELVVDSQLEGVEKPDPEIFRRALRRLELPARRAAYIGDIYSIDAVGARAAGLAPVIIDVVGEYSALDCPKIADLRELLAALDRPWGAA
jgi:putative hydrolase of the HAD superfamily